MKPTTHFVKSRTPAGKRKLVPVETRKKTGHDPDFSDQARVTPPRSDSVSLNHHLKLSNNGGAGPKTVTCVLCGTDVPSGEMLAHKKQAHGESLPPGRSKRKPKPAVLSASESLRSSQASGSQPGSVPPNVAKARVSKKKTKKMVRTHPERVSVYTVSGGLPSLGKRR